MRRRFSSDYKKRDLECLFSAACIRTAFKDLNLYWIKGAIAFVCFSFSFIFFLATCARLSWILSFWVHVKLFYRIVCGFLWVCAQTKTDRPLLLVEKQLTIDMKNCFSLPGLLIPQQHRSLHKTPPPRNSQQVCRHALDDDMVFKRYSTQGRVRQSGTNGKLIEWITAYIVVWVRRQKWPCNRTITPSRQWPASIITPIASDSQQPLFSRFDWAPVHPPVIAIEATDCV